MKPDKATLANRAFGCLMGVACGDAMGMPSSLMSPESIRRLFPKPIDDFMPAPSGHMIHDGMVAGQVTDDTLVTLVIADAILACGEVRSEKVAEMLVKWAERMHAFEGDFLGPTSARALHALRKGGDLEHSGKFGDTNGAAMRIAPVGILHPGDIDRTVTDVVKACLPTHNTDIAISGASAVAGAISSALVSGSLEFALRGYWEGLKRGSRLGNRWFGASIEKRTLWALDMVRSKRPLETIYQDLYDFIGAGVATTEAVPVAMALVILHNADPVAVIKAAANLGGDCDTVGAIAGGIAGAIGGIAAFPSRYVELIHRVNQFDLKWYADRLVDYAWKEAR